MQPKASARRAITARIILFAILVNAIAWLGPLLGGDPTEPGLGFLLWGITPLGAALIMRCGVWRDSAAGAFFLADGADALGGEHARQHAAGGLHRWGRVRHARRGAGVVQLLWGGKGADDEHLRGGWWRAVQAA